MKKSYYWNWLANVAKLSHTQCNGTMESTTSKSPIREKAVIAAFLAVITALTSLLNDAEAAAPRPTYEFYGTDIKKTYVIEDAGTIIPLLLHGGYGFLRAGKLTDSSNPVHEIDWKASLLAFSFGQKALKKPTVALVMQDRPNGTCQTAKSHGRIAITSICRRISQPASWTK